MKRRAGRPTVSALTRFWSHVEDGDGCWVWTGHTNNRGYGQFAVNKRVRMYAHRFSWEIHNAAEIPAGLVLDHLCENPPCVNPAHLEPVTQLVNTRRWYANARRRRSVTQ